MTLPPSSSSERFATAVPSRRSEYCFDTSSTVQIASAPQGSWLPRCRSFRWRHPARTPRLRRRRSSRGRRTSLHGHSSALLDHPSCHSRAESSGSSRLASSAAVRLCFRARRCSAGRERGCRLVVAATPAYRNGNKQDQQARQRHGPERTTSSESLLAQRPRAFPERTAVFIRPTGVRPSALDAEPPIALGARDRSYRHQVPRRSGVRPRIGGTPVRDRRGGSPWRG